MYSNTERCKSVYDSKYLVSPCFLLGPIINKLDNLGMERHNQLREPGSVTRIELYDET